MACTKQLNRLRQRQTNLLNFVSLYQSLYINLPYIRDLRPELKDPEDIELWNELLKAANTYDEQAEADSFRIIIHEMYVTRTINIFNDYISNLLTLIYRECPHALRAGGRSEIKLNEVLDADSLDDFIHDFTARRVDQLGRKSLSKLIDYLNERHGFSISTETEAFFQSRELFEVRHIIVHNGRRVSHSFLSRTDRDDLEVGQEFPLSMEYITSHTTRLEILAKEIDDQAIDKFDLATEEEREW